MHAYGDLICDGVDFPVEGKQGRDSVCMGRPETLRFVKDVVDELKRPSFRPAPPFIWAMTGRLPRHGKNAGIARTA